MSRTAFWFDWWTGVVVFIFLNAGPVCGQFSFTPLGDFSPYGVSADGSVLVGRTGSGFGPVAARWTRAEGTVRLGFLGNMPGRNPESHAAAISADGSVIVGWSTTPTTMWEAFRWTRAEGMVGLGFLADSPGAGTYSTAADVSTDGSVVVGSSRSNDTTEAFRWTEASGMVGLGDLPGDTFRSKALSVSGDGLVVVGRSYSDNGLEAFRWTGSDGMMGLGDLPGGHFSSTPFGTSANGSIVVGIGNQDRGVAPFLWTADQGMIALQDSGGTRAFGALDISADGNVIVGGGSNNGALFWTPSSGWVVLKDYLIANGVSDIGGLSLSNALAVSADGRTIFGNGNNSAGQATYWVATIPEPSTFVLAALALAAIVAFRFRRPCALKLRLLPVFLLTFLTPLAASAQFSFTPLDGLPGRNFFSNLWAFTPNGPIAAGWIGSERGTEAFRWTEETAVTWLGDLPGGPFYSRAFGISDDGSVVVGESADEHRLFSSGTGPAGTAFRWTAESGMVGLGSLPGHFGSTATAVSADGTVIVGVSGNDSITSTVAFHWTASEGMTELLERQPGVYSQATDISADGKVVIGWTKSQSQPLETFHWSRATGLTLLGAGSFPYGVSADGSVVVGLLGHGVPGEGGAAYWTAEEGWVDLGLTTPATDVSADGGVIASGPKLWLRDSGWIDLREVLISNGIPELENWSRFMVFDVSPDGKTISGRGENPLGQNQAWIATIPEPSTFVLAAFASAAGIVFSVHRRRGVKMRMPGN